MGSSNILNDDFDFQSAPALDRSAFRGAPMKVLLPAGESLYRMISTQTSSSPGNAILTGKWWFDQAAHTRLSKLASQTASSLPAAGHARLAISRKFSPKMEHLCKIRLKEPVYVWRGAARWQFDETLGVTLIGGLEQYYVPSLAVDPEGLSSRVAALETFGYLLG